MIAKLIGRLWRSRIVRRLSTWWECRQRRCSYYGHYLAYGPADMPHETYHLVEERAIEHFRTCTYDARHNYHRLCPTCSSYERRVRA